MDKQLLNIYSAKRISANYIINKYGSNIFLDNLKYFFHNYMDNKLKLRNIYISDGYIFRFEFFVINDDDKEKIKNIELANSRILQHEIFEEIGSEFSNKLMIFVKNKLFEEVEKINKEIDLEENKVKAHPLTLTTFRYLKNSEILRFELLF